MQSYLECLRFFLATEDKFLTMISEMTKEAARNYMAWGIVLVLKPFRLRNQLLSKNHRRRLKKKTQSLLQMSINTSMQPNGSDSANDSTCMVVQVTVLGKHDNWPVSNRLFFLTTLLECLMNVAYPISGTLVTCPLFKVDFWVNICCMGLPL